MAARIRAMTVALAIMVYFVSMFLTVAEERDGGISSSIPGWVGFLVGICVLFEWQAYASPRILLLFVAWLANPNSWLGVGCLIANRSIAALVAGVISFNLALVVLLLCPPSELVYPAFWTWLGSFAVLIVGSSLSTFVARGEPASDGGAIASGPVSGTVDERFQP